MFELDPRLKNDTLCLGSLSLCRVLLMNDSQYPWVILVPEVDAVTEVYQLSAEQRAILADESNQVAQLLAQEFSADKMNIAALGNVVSQLHIHHIVRYQSDAAWPAPIWGLHPVKPYEAEQLAIMVTRLKKMLGNISSFNAK